MTSTQHPTIPGVVVETTLIEPGRWFRQVCYYDDPNDNVLLVDACSDDPASLSVDAEMFSSEHTETVIEMIRDQAAWLAAQGATT